MPVPTGVDNDRLPLHPYRTHRLFNHESHMQISAPVDAGLLLLFWGGVAVPDIERFV